MFSAAQALATAAIAKKMIKEANMPFFRPTGYFCEMLKSEEHMVKIKKQYLEQEAARKAAEDARKQRLNRKYGKKMQTQRELEKQKTRTEAVKELNKLRKRKDSGTKGRKSNDDNDDEFGITVEDALDKMDKARPSRSSGKRAKREPTVSKKRQARNEKFGFGGKKRGLKRNTKESANEDVFDARKNRAPFKGLSGRKFGGGVRKPFNNKNNKKKGGKKINRPGKLRRQQIRQKKASKSK